MESLGKPRKILKDRLDDTMPAQLEARRDFLRRLRAAVRWVNMNKQEELWYLSTNQKERAQEVLLKKGSRTKW